MSDLHDYWTSVGEALARIDRADAGKPRRKVIILGAGMAGLAAAFELHTRGHQVEILEGSEKPGGRVQTRRFRNGSHGERGAMRIPSAHDYTHHYIREAGLGPVDLRRFYNSRGTGFYDVRNRIVRESDYRQLLPLFPNLTETERAVAERDGFGGLLGSAMLPLMRRLEPKYRALLDGDFSDSELADLDRGTWRNYLSTMLSQDASALLGSALTLKASWSWSLAAILRDEIHQLPRDGSTNYYCEIKDGLDRLPLGLADRLPAGMIRYRVKVVDVEKQDRGGIVHLEDPQTGRREQKPFDWLLCTLPFPVLRDMQLATFSPAKREAIQGIRYVSSTKVLLNYDQRWWQETPLGLCGGRSLSDQPGERAAIPRQTYYPNDCVNDPCGLLATEPPGGIKLETAFGVEYSSLFGLYVGDAPTGEKLPSLESAEQVSGPGTILGAYTITDGAVELCRMGSGQAVSTVVNSLKRTHGVDVGDKLKESEAWCWDQAPFAKGALAITPPGDLVRYFANAKREEGTVYFAGEHVSIAPGWIQGALEASLREVARMLERN